MKMVGLWFLTPLSTIFQLYRCAQFVGGENRSTRRKQPTCRKSLTNFITYCCIEYTSSWKGFELTTLVVISTDCTGSCQSNYHTITTTTTPYENGILCVNVYPLSRDYILSYHMSLRFEFRVVMSARYDFRIKRCSVRLYLQLFEGGLLSCLRYMCMFEHSGVLHIFTIWVIWRGSCGGGELLALCRRLRSPPIFGGVCVTHLFGFLCCVFCLLCLFLSCVFCGRCCQFLWIAPSIFSNVYLRSFTAETFYKYVQSEPTEKCNLHTIIKGTSPSKYG